MVLYQIDKNFLESIKIKINCIGFKIGSFTWYGLQTDTKETCKQARAGFMKFPCFKIEKENTNSHMYKMLP